MDKVLHHRQLVLNTLTARADVVHKCSQLKTDAERFTHALETVLQFPPELWFDSAECTQKVTQRSIGLREDGNKSFIDGQYHEAVKKYTESIMYAVDSSEELALAYANRSAALFKLEKYKECVADIDRALNQKYPDRLKTKLYQRKGLCLMNLGRPGADSTFQEALVWLRKSNLSEADINKSRNELKKLISSPYTVAELPGNILQYPEPKILKPNTTIPCASDAVMLKYSKKFGRHLIASRKIKPGEFLIIEKPYCAKLKQEKIYTHCSHCFEVSWNMIPCECCVNVAYCSEICKDKAWDEYHEVECSVVGWLHCYQIDKALWISMKMVIMGTQKGKKLKALQQELKEVDRNADPRTKGFGDDGKFHSNQFRSVYSLSNNLDKYPTVALLQRALWVALTVCILAKESKIFGKQLTLDTLLLKNPDVIFLGELILKQLHICYPNLHDLGLTRGLNRDCASAIVPFSSLVNHSCDPNTLRKYHMGHLILCAAYPIEQGEQIFDIYGPRFAFMPKSERHQILKNWNFNCECLPCVENWPLLRDIPSYKIQPLTINNKKELYKTGLKLGIAYKNLIQNHNIENLISMLNEMLKAIEVLFELVPRPCKELIMLTELVHEFHTSGDAIFYYIPGSPASETTIGPSMFYLGLQKLLS